tara:strand:+ start:517 stop:1074 length:558 start_codon:yes stop_codon:yes gene_type:complete
MRNGIEKFTDILSKETCKLLIQHLEANIDMAQNCVYTETNNVQCYQLYLDQGSDLDSSVFKGIQKVLKEYCELYPHFHADSDMGYQLRKIYGATRLHVDAVSSKMRNCSIILGLNDDFEDGKFIFPNQQYTTKLGLGEAIIFPVYFMYPHTVEKPKGFRYTINTWITEDVDFTGYDTSVHPSGDA